MGRLFSSGCYLLAESPNRPQVTRQIRYPPQDLVKAEGVRGCPPAVVELTGQLAGSRGQRPERPRPKFDFCLPSVAVLAFSNSMLRLFPLLICTTESLKQQRFGPGRWAGRPWRPRRCCSRGRKAGRPRQGRPCCGSYCGEGRAGASGRDVVRRAGRPRRGVPAAAAARGERQGAPGRGAPAAIAAAVEDGRAPQAGAPAVTSFAGRGVPGGGVPAAAAARGERQGAPGRGAPAAVAAAVEDGRAPQAGAPAVKPWIAGRGAPGGGAPAVGTTSTGAGRGAPGGGNPADVGAGADGGAPAWGAPGLVSGRPAAAAGRPSSPAAGAGPTCPPAAGSSGVGISAQGAPLDVPSGAVATGNGGAGEGSGAVTVRSHRKKYRGKVVVGDDSSKVSTIFSVFNSNTDILKMVSSYKIPPTVLCRRAESDEPACDDSSGDLVIYEEMLEAGLRFPIPSPICSILRYFSLTPGRLAPNGWRVLLGFLALWRRVHNEDASPVAFHAAYSLTESPAPNRGWYYLAPRGGKLLTSLRSNCHSWKSHFFFVGGEWASETERALVPTRWSDAKRLEAPVLSMSQQQRLQAVRACPDSDKDLGVLLPKEGSGAGGSSSQSPLKRKAADRRAIGARLSSRSTPPSGSSGRSTPPSKAARVESTGGGSSPSVTFRASSLASTPPAEVQSSHRVASPVASPPPASSSATVAASEPLSLAVPSPAQSCPPRSGASARIPIKAGPMLGNPQVIREKLGRFVFPPEVTQINSLGTQKVIDTFLEALAQASTSSICLMSRAHHNIQLREENDSMQQELSAARKKIAALEAARGVSETDLVAARERATGAERLSFCRPARERASLSEAELGQTRERASLRESVLAVEIKAVHDRASRAEKELSDGLADAFIDGYEELRGKISAAFPDLDLSGFVPTEAPDGDDGGSDDAEDGDEDEDEEDEEGSSEDGEDEEGSSEGE
ncbi:hypothetical protein CKAN_02142500 [Cinnamomum micranthum f. kanehirae]|uniref:Transposase (putative) gypsy type domain-containing protein n=1 Tax=Cinnamomum micranthum f. kanehirae TaxID=337451 RepID=A0A443PN52_9MAGN|nr:hypothetical protein CKAN_02142500 [Cinnamomum micranthum f. kanehirae]